jgi:hypothetical protein
MAQTVAGGCFNKALHICERRISRRDADNWKRYSSCALAYIRGINSRAMF